jgi:hypothetical protein
MDIQTIMQNVINKAVWPAFVGAVVIMIIYAGFLFLSASGDPTKLSKAKMALMWAIVGVIVGILAFSVKGLIQGILG